MAILEVQGVSKSFIDPYGAPDGSNVNVIIRDASFTVEEGDTFAFVSPSGSGKSTMLSMAGLLLTPDSGTILVEGGVDVATLDDAALSRLRQRLFGFVFQSTQLVGSLRAIENVTTPAGFAGKLDFDPRQRAEELLERFGLADRMYHYPHQLSVGQKRRIAVARAMLLSPKVIIADEPTNDLDDESAVTVTEALFDYVSHGNALLYATHDMQLAERASTLMTMQDKSFKKAS